MYLIDKRHILEVIIPTLIPLEVAWRNTKRIEGASQCRRMSTDVSRLHSGQRDTHRDTRKPVLRVETTNVVWTGSHPIGYDVSAPAVPVLS
jgi:hypothetical protein